MTRARHEDIEERAPSRFIVGIDLGTTNSAMAWVDTAERSPRVRTFAVPQLVAPRVVETRETLPSCLYEPTAEELGQGALRLPWDTGEQRARIVGLLAREQGALAPGRLVVSAKSWLSHSGVDRTAAILPWHGDPEATRLSPTAASALILGHLRDAWDHAHPEHPLAEQDVVLTVPASFDEIARELTAQAAREAGLGRVVLLEEPQAAFFAWIDQHRAREHGALAAGQTVLVVDVGGGTTDLTLIEVRDDGAGGTRFHRTAVGEHLILGGDNLDLALAHHLEARFSPGGQLSPRQWSLLVRRCQQAKEVLLGERPPERLPISLPGGGTRLIGGALTTELGRSETEELLVEGFLPRVALGERPERRRSGFQEFGLPYAPDPAITRYLAAFLTDHRSESALAVRPDAVLLNGGFFAAAALRTRLLEVLGSWFGADYTPLVLRNDRLDLAVAHGAACYGRVRRGFGERIEAGLAHSYYVGVGGARLAAPTAVCLVPAGLREGETVALEEPAFELRVREPVEFPVHVSSRRTTDRPGELVAIDPEQLTALPPIRTVLQTGKDKGAETIGVRLEARLTPLGTLELACRERHGQRTWRLPFDVRSAIRGSWDHHLGAGETGGFLGEEVVARARARVQAVFAPGGTARPEELMQKLEAEVELGRHEWPPSLLRTLWEETLEHEAGRRRGVAHEARWLNLLGFGLRPGYGYAVDDWRMARTWRLAHGAVAHPRNPLCRAEWWVLWRRIAGGLSAGQQRKLAEPLLTQLRSPARASGHELAEIWRLLGALEALEPATKSWLGERACTEIETQGAGALSGALGWALARLGARVPVHGPLNAVVPPEEATRWLERLLALPTSGGELAFAMMQLARATGDRYRDLSSELRERAAVWLERVSAPPHYVELVRTGGELEQAEQRQVFGDSLPPGLVIE